MKHKPKFHFVSEVKKTTDTRERVAKLLRSYRQQPEKYCFIFREPGRYMVMPRGSGVVGVFETRPQ